MASKGVTEIDTMILDGRGPLTPIVYLPSGLSLVGVAAYCCERPKEMLQGIKSLSTDDTSCRDQAKSLQDYTYHKFMIFHGTEQGILPHLQGSNPRARDAERNFR